LSRFSAPRSPPRARAAAVAEHCRDGREEHAQQEQRADDGEHALMACCGRVKHGCERGHGEGRHRQQQQRRDHPRGLGGEAQSAVPQRACDERAAENEQAVDQDRSDERAPDHIDKARLEREQTDKKLGQVADRGLDHAREPRAQMAAKLVGRVAHHGGKRGKCHGAHREGRHCRGSGMRQQAGARTCRQRDRHHHQLRPPWSTAGRARGREPSARAGRVRVNCQPTLPR
jgi:hypothetical protein